MTIQELEILLRLTAALVQQNTLAINSIANTANAYATTGRLTAVDNKVSGLNTTINLIASQVSKLSTNLTEVNKLTKMLDTNIIDATIDDILLYDGDRWTNNRFTGGSGGSGGGTGLSNLTVSPSSITLDADGNTKVFSITTNSSWVITTDISWCTITRPDIETNPLFGTGNAAINISAYQNTDVYRSGTITVSLTDGSGITRIIFVNLLSDTGTPTPSISISPSNSLLLPSAGVSATINVISTGAWALSSIPSWMTVDKTESVGSSTIVITVTKNVDLARTHNLVVSLIENPTISATILVQQSGLTTGGIPVMSLSPAILKFSSIGGTQYIEVTATAGHTWTASIGGTTGKNWVSLSLYTGNGDATILVTTPANIDNGRSTAVIVKFDNYIGEHGVIISQASGINDSIKLQVSPNSINLDSHGTKKPIVVTCDDNWVVSTSSEWINLDKISGVYSDVVMVSATATSAYRTGSLTFGLANDPGVAVNVLINLYGTLPTSNTTYITDTTTPKPISVNSTGGSIKITGESNGLTMNMTGGGTAITRHVFTVDGVVKPLNGDNHDATWQTSVTQLTFLFLDIISIMPNVSGATRLINLKLYATGVNADDQAVIDILITLPTLATGDLYITSSTQFTGMLPAVGGYVTIEGTTNANLIYIKENVDIMVWHLFMANGSIQPYDYDPTWWVDYIGSSFQYSDKILIAPNTDTFTKKIIIRMYATNQSLLATTSTTIEILLEAAKLGQDLYIVNTTPSLNYYLSSSESTLKLTGYSNAKLLFLDIMYATLNIDHVRITYYSMIVNGIVMQETSTDLGRRLWVIPDNIGLFNFELVIGYRSNNTNQLGDWDRNSTIKLYCTDSNTVTTASDLDYMVVTVILPALYTPIQTPATTIIIDRPDGEYPQNALLVPSSGTSFILTGRTNASLIASNEQADYSMYGLNLLFNDMIIDGNPAEKIIVGNSVDQVYWLTGNTDLDKLVEFSVHVTFGEKQNDTTTIGVILFYGTEFLTINYVNNPTLPPSKANVWIDLALHPKGPDTKVSITSVTSTHRYDDGSDVEINGKMKGKYLYLNLAETFVLLNHATHNLNVLCTISDIVQSIIPLLVPDEYVFKFDIQPENTNELDFKITFTTPNNYDSAAQNSPLERPFIVRTSGFDTVNPTSAFARSLFTWY